MTNDQVLGSLDLPKILGVAVQLEDSNTATASVDLRDEVVTKTRGEWANLVKSKYPVLSTKLFDLGSSGWWSVTRTIANKALGSGQNLADISADQLAKVEKTEDEYLAGMKGKTAEEEAKRTAAENARVTGGETAAKRSSGGSKIPVQTPQPEQPIEEETLAQQPSQEPGLPKVRPSEEVIARAEQMAQMAGPYQGPVSRFFGELRRVWGRGQPEAEAIQTTAQVVTQAEPAPLNLFASLRNRLGFGKAATKTTTTVVTSGGKTAAKTTAATAGKVAVGAGEKAAVSTATSFGGKAAMWIATRLGVNLAPGIGQVISVGLIVKDILGGIGKGFKALFNKIAPEAETKTKTGLRKLLDSAGGVGLVGGAVIGGTVGAAFFGIGAVPGAIIGTVAGWAIGALGGGLLGGLSDTIGAIGRALTGQQTEQKPGLIGALFGGTMAAGAMISLGGAIFLPMFSTAYTWQYLQHAFYAPQTEQFEDEEKTTPPLVTVDKTVNKNYLPNNPTEKLVYKIVIKATGENEIDISIKDTMTWQGTSVTPPVPTTPNPATQTLAKGETKTINYQPYDASTFSDGTLENTVTVTAKDKKTGAVETASAGEIVTIGGTDDDRPYGFPAVGKVTSLDRIFGYGLAQNHGSIFRGTPWGGVYTYGGIDIIGSGGTPVYSTSKGKIIEAHYEDYNSGGAIYVETKDYVIEYLHLSEESINSILASGTKEVTRGQKLAVTSSKKYAHSDTPHIHYQIITKNGANVNFNDASHAGKCSEGKIEPVVPVQKQMITQNLVAPACN